MSVGDRRRSAGAANRQTNDIRWQAVPSVWAAACRRRAWVPRLTGPGCSSQTDRASSPSAISARAAVAGSEKSSRVCRFCRNRRRPATAFPETGIFICIILFLVLVIERRRCRAACGWRTDRQGFCGYRPLFQALSSMYRAACIPTILPTSPSSIPSNSTDT